MDAGNGSNQELGHDAREPIIQAVRVSLENLSKLTHVKSIAVALSGGCDSVVLLHALHAICVAPAQASVHALFPALFPAPIPALFPALISALIPARIQAITINHQLQLNSGDWADFCARLCAQLGVAHQVDVITITVNGQGVEGAARAARYASLRRLSQQAGCQVLALGHHQDDQVETILHQMLRGTGLSGASGMKALRQEQNGLWIWRPLLAVTRSQIEAYTKQCQLHWVDDPSNLDTHFARNALRQQILPTIDEHFAGGRKNIVRFAQLLAQCDEQIQAIALEDLNACRSDTAIADARLMTLSVVKIQKLAPTRQAWLLREWLKRADLKMPGQARLQAMLQQLVYAVSPARVGIAHDGIMLRRYRDGLSISRGGVLNTPDIDYEAVQDSALGLPSGRLINAVLEPAPRTLSQRFRLSKNRPNRSLKLQFQALGIAPWERQQSACLYDGNDLLWVAQLGMNHQWVVATGDRKIPRLR